MFNSLVVILEVGLAVALLVGCLVLAAGRGGVGHNPIVPRHVVMRDGRLEVAPEDVGGRGKRK